MAQAWQQYLVLEPVPSAEHEPTSRAAKHPGLTWHDHLVMLLHVAAEIEHGLMVQYLYAAYSLGGPDASATPERQDLIKHWQASLIKVAKEEMGHLLTVQNILCLIGAPVHFGRENYPWTVPYYPYPFRLEKLTRSSLACYVHAEMPPHITAMLKKYPELSRRFKEFTEKDKAWIDRLVKERARGQIHTVAAIYDEIVGIIGNEELIPDSAFDEESYVCQASWDDWGRGYGPELRRLDASGSAVGDPERQREANLLIMRAATRTEALTALKAIGSQGEAIHLEPKRTDELSHFERFLKIFQQYPDDWVPARDIPDNPTTRQFNKNDAVYIDNDHARDWGTLFNYRYRLLLTCLAHSFRLQRLSQAGEPNLRGMVMHRAFGEMYNIKTIAGIIVGLDLHKEGAPQGSPRFAGPPFEMPFMLTLPDAEPDAWRLHQEFLQGSIDVAELLLEQAKGAQRDYLLALKDLDRRAIASIDALLDGQGSRRK
ncbi:ferritin-like domain-containing protein [Taklimakanibacter deserti]|uniref:ferritin-like domain-containing protein n=1 Tax=Taklimakanibacter deserti TaxID=2267839 RepID=UPI000E64AFE5